jgi:hypothetical protein
MVCFFKLFYRQVFRKSYSNVAFFCRYRQVLLVFSVLRSFANAEAFICKRFCVDSETVLRLFFVAWRFVKLNERSLVNERALVDKFLSAH